MDWKYSLTPKLRRMLKNFKKKQPDLVESYNEQIEAIMKAPTSGKKLHGNLGGYYSLEWLFRAIPVESAIELITKRLLCVFRYKAKIL